MKNKLLFLPLLIFIVTSCSKNLVVDEFDGGKLEVNEFEFEHFDGKCKVTFKDRDKEVSARTTIRIRKDSLIWMAFSSSGFSGGKCLITKDSITIINNIEKEVYVFDYFELSERFNFKINYATIQAAAIGNLILKRQPTDLGGEKNGLFVLKQTLGSVKVDNYVDKETHKIVRVDMDESNSNNTASMAYEDFQVVGNQYFPYTGFISLFYKTKDINSVSTFNTSIEFEYSKGEISEKPLRFPFRVPKKYVWR